MKVAVFVTEAYYKKSDLYGVSGHVQIPLKAAVLLAESGVQVNLITTKPDGCNHLMINTPPSLKIKLVKHATRKWPREGVNKLKAAKQFWQLILLFRKEPFDIVHFFGGPKTGVLAVLLKILFPATKFIYSPISEPVITKSNTKVYRMFRKLDLVLSTTEYVSSKWASVVGMNKSSFARPGILKKITLEESILGVRDTVLYWRNADFENGADIMIEIVRKISSKYPHIRFVFAIRPGSIFQNDIEALPSEFQNVDVFVHPYPDGVSIETLLKKAIVVIAPYRKLSINPQMSILETLHAAVPVIASNIESNCEVVQEHLTGLLVSGSNPDDYCYNIERLLNDKEELSKLQRNAYPISSEKFNWSSFASQLRVQYLNLVGGM